MARDTKDYGAGHPITISSLALLGKLWRCQGLLAKAETARRAVAELRRKVQGETNPEFASALEELGQVLSTQVRITHAPVNMWQCCGSCKKFRARVMRQSRYLNKPLTPDALYLAGTMLA